MSGLGEMSPNMVTFSLDFVCKESVCGRRRLKSCLRGQAAHDGIRPSKAFRATGTARCYRRARSDEGHPSS
jgi:hypothetical protein